MKTHIQIKNTYDLNSLRLQKIACNSSDDINLKFLKAEL